MPNGEIKSLVRQIRPALQRTNLTEDQREQLIYDLVREVYDYVKFDVDGPDADTPERARIGRQLDDLLPPVRPHE